jgi:4-hydroxy-tetrahydrodipicolinate reductase
MGSTVCLAVDGAEDMTLAAAVDPGHAGLELGSLVHGLSDEAAALPVMGEPTEGADVAVDFTVADAARANLSWCAAHGVHAVCGTTGLEPADLAELGQLFAQSGANAVVAPNFSIGAALMMRCAELCAPWFDGIEILELHHDRKKDAPSGTSLSTAERVDHARHRPLGPDPTERQVLAGTRGGEAAGGVHVHSIRLPGLVAHQEVLFGLPGETLSIRHDSTDRISFMGGVLLAIRNVPRLEGLTAGIEPLLKLMEDSAGA